MVSFFQHKIEKNCGPCRERYSCYIYQYIFFFQRLMENIRVRRAGFAFRQEYDLALQRWVVCLDHYKCLLIRCGEPSGMSFIISDQRANVVNLVVSSIMRWDWSSDEPVTCILTYSHARTNVPPPPPPPIAIASINESVIWRINPLIVAVTSIKFKFAFLHA